MKKYKVHPVVDNHIWVTTQYMRKGKPVDCIAFQIDCPGRWVEDEYNCHVDGCDYQFPTKEEALECGAKILRMNGEPYEFIQTEEVFNPYKPNV